MSSENGRLIGERYQLGELLGRGGMAEVRKGTDLRLGRTVAVKRLRTDLAGDATFQARFRREAQSSASLNHPSVVAVYDTGEERSTDGSDVAQPYIVMEHVAGRTLRDILREGRKILPERALEITSGVLSALDYSHRAGIVHRDIKPGNVMLTPSGDVKVMDFGIARAMSDAQSTMTQTAAVVGTAQYLSPEQARGETVDSRSDVYSTGCLLYELLTGRPPFVGDSPVAVAYQHVREQPRPPSDHDADLPPEVDAIVMRALAKRVDDRYQSAADMRGDIERYLAGHPVHTALAPAAAAAPPPTVPTPAATAAASAPAVPPRDDDPRRGRRLLVLLGLLAVVVIVAAAVLFPRMTESPNDQQEVPDLVRLSEDDARAAIGENGLVVGDIERRADDRVPAGRVISQDPDPSSFVAAATPIDLVVSDGVAQVSVPAVVGEQRVAASTQLRNANLGVDPVAVDSDEPANRVISLEPGAGTNVDEGTVVTLNYSRGPAEIPDVRTMLQGEAIRVIEGAGFTPVVRQEPDSEEPAGTVVDQSPDAGATAVQGSEVNLFVSVYEEPSESPSASDSDTSGPGASETPSDDASAGTGRGPSNNGSGGSGGNGGGRGGGGGGRGGG